MEKRGAGDAVRAGGGGGARRGVARLRGPVSVGDAGDVREPPGADPVPGGRAGDMGDGVYGGHVHGGGDDAAGVRGERPGAATGADRRRGREVRRRRQSAGLSDAPDDFPERRRGEERVHDSERPAEVRRVPLPPGGVLSVRGGAADSQRGNGDHGVPGDLSDAGDHGGSRRDDQGRIGQGAVAGHDRADGLPGLRERDAGAGAGRAAVVDRHHGKGRRSVAASGVRPEERRDGRAGAHRRGGHGQAERADAAAGRGDVATSGGRCEPAGREHADAGAADEDRGRCGRADAGLSGAAGALAGSGRGGGGGGVCVHVRGGAGVHGHLCEARQRRVVYLGGDGYARDRAWGNLLRAAAEAVDAPDIDGHADRGAGGEERRVREGHAHAGAAAGRGDAAGLAGGTVVTLVHLLTITIRWVPNNAEFGSLQLTWHGVFTAVGIAAGVYLGAWLGRREGFTEDDAYSVALVGVPAGIIGARAVYVLGNKEAFP